MNISWMTDDMVKPKRVIVIFNQKLVTDSQIAIFQAMSIQFEWMY